MNAKTAVELQEVTKRYGSHVAVDALSLSVPIGSVYGFIGPNGSGKTTTLRMIMRIIHPDQGTVGVLGRFDRGAANDDVGYLPEERSLYKKMKVRDVLRFCAALKNYQAGADKIDRWLSIMGLEGYATKPVQALSKGMSQKVQFIATVLHKPRLVLLDEPFSGLDPVNAVVLRDLVLELRRGGTTVIFSTHDMFVAEKLCDAIFMIYRGRKVLDGTLSSIQNQYGADVVRVRIESAGQAVQLDHLPGVVKVTDFGNLQELRMSPGTDSDELLQRLMSLGTVRHFEVTPPTLQDIFVRIASPEMKGEQVLA